MSTHLLLIHALSPVHAGTGHSPGAIDLPIARDKATGFPILPGSGLKGAMRSHLTRTEPREVKGVFGPETTGAAEHAGGLWVGDANLVALPVRSVVGTFAWATSPFLLGRFLRDAAEAGLKPPKPISGPPVAGCLTSKPTRLKDGTKAYFEDLDFSVDENERVGELAAWMGSQYFDDEFWRARFTERFCVVHDDVMSYLGQHGTDIVNRIRLENDTKTVAKGALWSEESLPTETLLAAHVVVAPNEKTKSAFDLANVLRSYSGRTLQLGGDATVGRGRCMLRVVGGGQ